MPTDVIATVRTFIIEELEWPGTDEQLGDDVSLIVEGVLDSLNLLEVAHFVQSRFGVKIDESEVIAVNFETLSAIEKFVLDRLAADAERSAR